MLVNSSPWLPIQKAVFVAQTLQGAKPAGDGRAGNDDQQRVEQHIHAELLELWLDTGDGRRDVQAGGQPGGGDPEHGELRVDGAADGEGQDLAERDAEQKPYLRPHSVR
jgi:hypothetical protein